MSAALSDRDAEFDRILVAARHMAEKLNIRIDIDPEKAKLVDFSINGEISPAAVVRKKSK